MARFKQNNLECDHPPIVAVRENGADPHYAPIESGERLKEIQKGDLAQTSSHIDSLNRHYAVISNLDVQR